jgi:SAM-dependent methyltransferase
MLTRFLRRQGKLSDRLGLSAFIRMAYEMILGRSPDARGFADFRAKLKSGEMTRDQFLWCLIGSDELRRNRLHPEGYTGTSRGLIALHESRCRMVRQLPKADVIVDLGGGTEHSPDGALVLMGYPYAFRTLTVVEPPQGERHELYKGVCRDEVQSYQTGRGELRYLYRSMGDLGPIPDGSVDLVFCGEAIEHVTREEAERVFAEARRVLRPGGSFCFDTPNRAVTRLQVGEAFINPDHKHEYTHAELVAALIRHGFTIAEARGMNWVPESVRSGSICTDELIANVGLFDDVENCYLLYYRCR